jgi:hypothetical protein
MDDFKKDEKSKAGEALHRDWEQTKHDLSKKKGEELNQNVADTLKQAAGKEYIPPEGVPNSNLDKK